MQPIKTLVKRVRRVVHDTDAITYDDDEIVWTLNQGIRYIRRIIADTRPEKLVAETVSGILEPGENSIDLPYRPVLFMYVRAGDEVESVTEYTASDKIYHNYNLIYHNKSPIYNLHTLTKYKTYQIPEVNMSQIQGDLGRKGTPQSYFLTGDKTVTIYPVPELVTQYEILAIPDIDDLTIDDTSPLLHEFDDLLVEYANLRLSIENEYDVSQDSQIMANIQNQVIRLLRIPPKGVMVQGYWGRPLDAGHRPYRRGAW